MYRRADRCDKWKIAGLQSTHYDLHSPPPRNNIATSLSVFNLDTYYIEIILFSFHSLFS